jgi:hypothetical protein
MAAGIAGSACYRHSYSNPIAKRIAARIYPTAKHHRTPHYNPLIQTIASRIYPIGRAFLDTAYRMMKSWLPKMPVLASFTYVNVEKIEGQEKIERIVFPSLFRVTGKDILPDQKVYLFGTTHTFKVTDYPPEALALINACNLLLSEFPAEMALSKNPYEWNLHEEINSIHVHKKLLSVDEEWIGTLLSAYENAAGKVDRNILFSKLKEKSREIQADQIRWLDRLSLADQTKIQTRLDECGLHIRDLDPLLVSHFLSVINEQRFRNYDFNTVDVAILNNFQKRNNSILELEDKLSDLSSSFDDRMQDILNYDLESTLEDILLELEPIAEEPDELEQTLRELQETAEKVVPFTYCEGTKCVEFKTSEALRSQLSLIQEARKLNMLRSLLDNKIYFNFEEYEKNWLADPAAADWTTPYRNKTFYPKIPVAIQQKKDIAVVCGAFHLVGETGMVRSLRREGYDVSHVKPLEKQTL